MSVTKSDKIALQPTGDRPDLSIRLAVAMTLLAVILEAPPQMSVLATSAAIAGLLLQSLIRNRWFWLVLLLLFSLSPIRRPWAALDNHNWLQVYWFAAIAVTRWTTNPDASLRLVARWLLGLAFAFAVTWKLLAPEFIGGDFFEFTFVSDHRLGDVLVALGVQDAGTVATNRSVIADWRDAGVEVTGSDALVSRAAMLLGPPLAWLTILIEGAVAVAYLAPLPDRFRWARDATLLLFIVATYPLAPVIPFGWLLIAMGAATSDLPPRIVAPTYVAAFVLVGLLSERSALLEMLSNLLS